MIFSRAYLIIKTLRDFKDGLSLEELSEEIQKRYPTDKVARWLAVGDNSGLRRVIEDELYPCIWYDAGGCIFDSEAKRYHSIPRVNEDLKKQFEKESHLRENG